MFAYCCLVLCFQVKAQNWVALDTGIHQGPIVSFPYGLLADTANNNVIAFGAEYPSSYYPTNRGGFTVWNNTVHKWQQWYPSIASGSYGNEVVLFNNKVLYFYPFWENNDASKPRTCILRFSDATDMDTLKILQSQDWLPFRNCLYNSKLLLVGDYNNNPANAIATFDGDTIIPFGDTAITAISSVCMFNGELYAAGTLGNGRHGIAKYLATGWKRIFQVDGGTAFITGLRIYNSRMYAYGSWCEDQSPNNFGNSIVAFDGTNWDKLGGGITNTFGCIYNQVWDAVVCNNKLYVSGKFTHAAQLPDNKMVYWNDTSWCSLHKDLDSTGILYRLEVLNDTLYAAADFKKMYGNTTYGLVAKMQNMGYADTCTSSFVSVKEYHNNQDITVYPNPANDVLTVKSSIEISHIEMFDLAGQLLLYQNIDSKEYRLQLNGIAEGIYFVRIICVNGVVGTYKTGVNH